MVRLRDEGLNCCLTLMAISSKSKIPESHRLMSASKELGDSNNNNSDNNVFI